MDSALALANWILAHPTLVPSGHLKLQKLLFYAVGAATAHDLERDLGDIRFVAWKHGPVNIPVYEKYRGSGRDPLLAPPVHEVPQYRAEVERLLSDVLTVYGRLTPWQLREESHLEEPWQTTDQSAEIAPPAMKAHFKRKFASGDVAVPRNLLRAWSFDVDSIPTQRWPSLHALACSLSA